MTAYSVDSDQLFSATAAVRGTADRLQSETTAMLSQLTQLQSSWTGSAAVAFQGVLDRWGSAQRQVEESLIEINAALATAGRQYADAEQLNAGLFR